MRFTNERLKLAVGLAAITAVFLFFRLRTLGHVLMWDEAWNIMSLRAFVEARTADPFYWYHNFHPPLYMALASALAPLRNGIDVRMEYLSLFFSYATLLVVYALSAKIGGRRYALIASAILALMPSSVAYDTWIKRDGAASFLGYLAILLLLDRRYLWCGACLGLSLLSKECGVFFAIAAVLVLLLSEEGQKTRKTLLIILTAAVISAWWYVLYSPSFGELFATYFKRTLYGDLWLNSPFYYVKKLLPDLSPAGSILFVIGFLYCLFLVLKKKEKAPTAPLAVFLSAYLPVSLLFSVKTPWLTLAARPALAMISAYGAVLLLEKKKVIFAVVSALLVLSGFYFSYEDYHAHTYPNGWPGANASRELAEYLNNNIKPGEKLIMTEFAYWQMPICPVFAYYTKHIPVRLIKMGKNSDYVLKEMKKTGAKWLSVQNSDDPRHNFNYLIEGLEERPDLGKGARVAWSVVWRIGS